MRRIRRYTPQDNKYGRVGSGRVGPVEPIFRELYRIRDRIDLPQLGLRQRTGLGMATIGGAETGLIDPRVSTLVRWALGLWHEDAPYGYRLALVPASAPVVREVDDGHRGDAGLPAAA